MGMRVLITGANGFIGTQLLPRLLKDGYEVIAYDLKSSFSQDRFPERIRIISGDLSEGEGLDQIAWEDLDAVIHLASAGVKASNRDWHDCIAVNIIGTEQLLYSMSAVDNPPLLIYPRTFYEDHINDIPGFKQNPYIITKKAGTKIVELWARDNKNVKVVFGTIFQAYGAGDDAGNVLTYTVNCLKNGISAELGSGKGLRDWIYIDDLINAFVKSLYTSGNRIQHYDFGTGKLTSIKEIVERIAELMGCANEMLNFDSARDRNDTEIRAFAKNMLKGLKPIKSLEERLIDLINDIT